MPDELASHFWELFFAFIGIVNGATVLWLFLAKRKADREAKRGQQQ